MTTPPNSTALKPLDALQAVLSSLDALRNGRALYVLLATFAVSGWLFTSAQGALARSNETWGAIYAGLSIFSAFYGASAAGLLLLDQARGRPLREVADAVADALALGHRLLAVLLLAACGPLLVLLAAAALIGLARADISGALGPWLFGLTVPVAVVSLGVCGLALTALVVPLAGPAIWGGWSIAQTLRWLWLQVRQRFVLAAVLMAAVAGLSSLIAALAAAVVMTGGRIVALLSIFVGGVDMPAQLFMAGLFGYGLRGVPPGAVNSAHGSAALMGGGMVFALALLVPVLVTLRGACAAFLVLQRPQDDCPALMPAIEADNTPITAPITLPAFAPAESTVMPTVAQHHPQPPSMTTTETHLAVPAQGPGALP